MSELIGEVADHLQKAHRVLFITGAGISADSGLPTYRGVGGLYDDILTDDELPIEVALSGTMLRSRPALTWKYVLEIEKACRGAVPNRGHEIIAEIERQKPETWVLTQNIDGFHRRAGSQNLIEIHGHLLDLQCTRCDWEEEVANFSYLALPPKCIRCNGPIRPDVVFFGEMLPEKKIEMLYSEMARGFDMVFSVGTTSVFPYISEPVLAARQAGVPTVEINPGETDISQLVDYRLQMGAAAALAALVG
jgi:NAD-dependent deacetylase